MPPDYPVSCSDTSSRWQHPCYEPEPSAGHSSHPVRSSRCTLLGIKFVLWRVKWHLLQHHSHSSGPPSLTPMRYTCSFLFVSSAEICKELFMLECTIIEMYIPNQICQLETLKISLSLSIFRVLHHILKMTNFIFFRLWVHFLTHILLVPRLEPVPIHQDGGCPHPLTSEPWI